MNIEKWDEYIRITDAMDELIENMDDSSQIKNVVSHVCNYGGKRIRPIILMLSTDICGGDSKTSINAALAVELMHSASLIHDDLIDDGIIRRGVPSAHKKFGHSAAMLCGDFLISKSIELMSSYGHNAITEFGQAGMSMAHGETIDLGGDDAGFVEVNYFDCIYKKTASLFAACASIGAYISGADDEMVHRCRLYGEYMGTAYQIVDDLLEYLHEIDDKSSVRKSVTLPQIYTKQMTHEEAVNKTVDKVDEYVTQAKNIIVGFESENGKDKLLQITNHITIDMLPENYF
ncbi:Polyprenyl synthetase [Methanohalobium evestigatum Z-7303]|uniref:Polyprenyl synthetase n=2 Tax=root TaxID=1 RepID=D7E6D8_METEZ|nr:polyprenyl synthetase family protein [Methanohalobium evestigatum]ADI73160.1 Polyprenyl synthetase [Methanohalobium evestigatum Z-7303]AGF93257.1 polyprenyl synthetase [uncultured organism]